MRFGAVGTAEVPAVPRRAWYVLMLTSFGQFFVIFDSTVLNVGFASIEKDFSNVARTTLAWALTSYSIGTASLLLLAGRVADLFGRRRIFLIGISIFALGSLGAGLAPNVGVLIATRTVQSVGGALMVPTSIALALPEFPPERRSLAVGVWGSIAALAGGLGPPLGAGVIELGGWRWIFFINIPVVVLVVVSGRNVLRESKGSSTGTGLDMLSVPLGTTGLALLTLGVLQGAKWGWTSPGITASFVGAIVFGWIVVRRSLTHAEPLLDIAIFRQRRFTAASIATFTLNLPVAGFWFSAPLFFQTVWDWSVLKSGFAIMPTPVIIFVTASFAGRYSDRGLVKPIIGTGIGCCAIGIVGLAAFLDAESNYWMHYLPFAAIYGIGLGLSWSTLTAAALIGIDQEKFGAANGTNLTFRQVGGAMGVALSIAVAGEAGVPGSAAAFHRVWLVLAVWVALTFVFFVAAYPRISLPTKEAHN
ncbi:MAG: DHA2 family efflux MFS transporter permease subunit [Actinobacteria bacterium]|nr:DHA2 family efflux MFS transporter permease subunit [Actinomycetota bacterium]